MNWNYWLPWRECPQNGTEDSTYEEQVIERCDHDFKQTTKRLGPCLVNATIENGYLVVPVEERVEEFCEKCGKPGDRYKGRDYETAYTGEWTRISYRLVFEPAFKMDPDLSIEDALTEPVGADGEDESRVIVNTSEETYGVTD